MSPRQVHLILLAPHPLVEAEVEWWDFWKAFQVSCWTLLCSFFNIFFRTISLYTWNRPTGIIYICCEIFAVIVSINISFSVITWIKRWQMIIFLFIPLTLPSFGFLHQENCSFRNSHKTSVDACYWNSLSVNDCVCSSWQNVCV